MTHRLFLLVALFATQAHAANAPPVAEDSAFDTDEDTALNVQLRAHDADNDAITFRLVTAPKNGTASIESGGKLAYTPKKDWHGKDQLVLEVSDGKARATKTVVINVSSSNDAPTASPVELTGLEDKPVKGQIVAADADGDPLSYSVGDAPAKASVDVDAHTGRFTLVPGENVTGAVKFTIKVSDGTTDISVPVGVTLAPVNDAPVTRDEKASTNEDEPLKGKFAASDVDKDALTFTLTAEPKHGAVVIDGAKGTFVYTPAKDYAGADEFAYAVTDGKATAKSKIEIEVVNVNDPPTTFPLAIEGNEDSPIKGKVLAKDFDGDEVYFTLKGEPKSGDVEVDHTSGELVYTPKQDFFGSDVFTVEASDITGGALSTVTVTVKPVNDAPVAASDSASGDEDQPIAGKLKASDVDKDALTFSLKKGPKKGVVEVKSDGAFRFTPSANENGADAFEFEVSDGKAKSDGTLTLAVRPQNDAPVTSDVKLGTNEDTLVRGKITASDIDKDKLSYALGKKAAKKGKVELDEATGAFAYQPNLNENGDDAFAITVSDGTAEVEANVAVAVAAVNDAPVAEKQDAKGDEDQPVKGKVIATDVDKDALTFTVVQKPRSGAVEMDARTGAYTYTPSANSHGDDAFKFEVTDGKLRSAADVKLVVAEVNDAPEVKGQTLAVIEDKAATGSVPASDVDKDKLTWSLGKPPAKGSVTVDASSGRYTYTPALNENGADTFVVAVADGRGASTDAAVSVAIAPVNDAPVADAHQDQGKEDEPIKGQLSASDVDHDALTFTAVSKPRFGTVAVDPSSGAFTYTPNADASGDDGFRFEVTDGKLRASADVKLAVAAVNDAPVPKDVAVTAVEDHDAAGKVLASDVDKDALTFRVKKPAQNGVAFVDDATGAFRYVPARDAHGPDSFVVECSDGFLATDATVTVAVAPAPDAPLVDLQPIETAEDEPVSSKLAALDADGDDVTFKILTPPRLGTAELQGDGKTLRFTPRADANGEDQVVVEASDGSNKVRATIPIRIAARNDAPTVDAVTTQTLEETPLAVALVAHDKDGDAVKLALDKKPPEGVTLAGDILRVVPSKDFAGPIEVNVTPSDAAGAGPVQRVVVNVVNVDDAPVAADLVLQAGDKPQSGRIEASDVDAGDELTFTLAVPPKLGAVTLDDAHTGRFTYTPSGAPRDDSFRIRVRDKAGASVSATVRVASAPPAATKPGTKPAPAPVKPVPVPATPKPVASATPHS